MATNAMFRRPSSPSLGFLLTRPSSSALARCSNYSSSKSSLVSSFSTRGVLSHSPPDPSTTILMSCFRRAKTEGVLTSNCCSFGRNSLSLRAQSPRLRVKGNSPLTLPPAKNPPADLTRNASSLLVQLWLPEMRTALEGLLLQQTQALHSPTLAITISLAPTNANAALQPEVGHRYTTAGSPRFTRRDEHLEVSFLKASSRAGKRASTADLHWSSEVSSLLLRNQGMNYAASSARSGPPCPSRTQKTEMDQVMGA